MALPFAPATPRELDEGPRDGEAWNPVRERHIASGRRTPMQPQAGTLPMIVFRRYDDVHRLGRERPLLRDPAQAKQDGGRLHTDKSRHALGCECRSKARQLTGGMHRIDMNAAEDCNCPAGLAIASDMTSGSAGRDEGTPRSRQWNGHRATVHACRSIPAGQAINCGPPTP